MVMRLLNLMILKIAALASAATWNQHVGDVRETIIGPVVRVQHVMFLAPRVVRLRIGN